MRQSAGEAVTRGLKYPYWGGAYPIRGGGFHRRGRPTSITNLAGSQEKLREPLADLAENSRTPSLWSALCDVLFPRMAYLCGFWPKKSVAVSRGVSRCGPNLAGFWPDSGRKLAGFRPNQLFFGSEQSNSSDQFYGPPPSPKARSHAADSRRRNSASVYERPVGSTNLSSVRPPRRNSAPLVFPRTSS